VLLFKVSFFQNTEALLSATASHFKNMRYDEMKKKKQEGFFLFLILKFKHICVNKLISNHESFLNCIFLKHQLIKFIKINIVFSLLI